MQSDTEVQLVEAAVVDPADDVFHGSQIGISGGLGIHCGAEGSDLRWPGRCCRHGFQQCGPALQRDRVVQFAPAEA
jgi:hypothetical protein